MKKIGNQIKKRAKEIIALLCFTSMLTSALPVYAIGAAAEESFDLTPIEADQVPMQTVYDSPASDWKSQTLPLGNGYLGASVYGGVESEEILINEHTLWSGGPGASASYDGGMSDNTSTEQKKQALMGVREELAEVMYNFTAGYTPGIGASNTQNYPNLSSNLNSLIEVLKGEKDNFGSYQELGRIHIDDAEGNNMVAYAVGCNDTNVSALFDGSVNGATNNDGKWFSANGGDWLDESIDIYPFDIIMQYFEPKAVKSYAITLGNDTARMQRIPVKWTFYGSDNGVEWIELHHVESSGFSSSTDREEIWQSKTFELDREVSYLNYKLTIEANDGGWGVEIGEIQLFEAPEGEETEEIGEFVTAYGEGCYANSYSSNDANARISNLFDNNTGTKWYSADGSPSGTVFDETPDTLILQYSGKYPISGYSMTTANDSVRWGRDPAKWNIYGSDDGKSWELIENYNPDTRSFTAEYQTVNFELESAVSYSYYKFEFVALWGGTVNAVGVQLSEFSLTPYVPVAEGVGEFVTAYGENCYNTDYNANVTCHIRNLFDGVIEVKNNKWFSGDGAPAGATFDDQPDSLIIEYSAEYPISGYMMAMGDDSVKWGRDPIHWNLYGSNNGGESWELIETVNPGSRIFTAEYEQKTFELESPASYTLYKFEFVKITGGTDPGFGVQLSELSLTPYVPAEEEDDTPAKLVTAYGEGCYNGEYNANVTCHIRNLFDGVIEVKNNKWYSADGAPWGDLFEAPENLILQYDKPLTLGSYMMALGNDNISTGRTPKSWKLHGSNDGKTWFEIHYIEDSAFASVAEGTDRYETKTFTLAEPVSYQWYKFEFLSVVGNATEPRLAAGVQIGELKLNEYDPNAVPEESNEPSDYERKLDLDNATATVSYKIGNASYNREYFVSNPGNFIGARLTATDGVMNKIIRFSTPQAKATVTAEGNVITITGWPADHTQEEKLLFAAQIKVITDGRLITGSNYIYVSGATNIELYMTAGTNYQQCMDDSFDYFSDEDPLDAVKARLAALEGKSYEELKAVHVADYKELYDRVKVNFGATEQPTKTTDALLAGYRNGTNSASENRYLEALYYHFGRYLLIASSREGSLPANLQGIWGEGLKMPWDADYHANINVQMNYWLAQSTNLAECHEPYIQYINSLVSRGHITANTYHYNVNDADAEVRGWTTYHENNIWGNTAPGNWAQSFYFPVAGAWLALDIWEQYAFTQDAAALADSYETLKGAALFWVDNLVVDPRDGTLVASPSYSPEHGPFSLGASCDQTIIWEVFNSAIKAAEVMGDNGAEIQEIKTAMSKLSLPTIGVNGQYMEWKDEITLDVTGDNQHRHINHLFGIYPGTLVVDDRSEIDEAFVDAIVQTLNTRGDGGPGWGKAWKMNIWARLHDGEHAGRLVSEVLKQDTYNNLFDKYAASNVFQIDGNFGTVAGMTEMLLQSQGEVIELLPALPSMWYGTAVTGLCARGNVEVDIKSDANGKLEKAILHAGSANDALSIKAEGLGGFIVVDSEGNKVAVSRGEDTITFAAEAGESYTLVKGTPVSDISLDKSEIKLEVGESAELIATVEPADATNDDIAWTSSDTKVATVVNGVVTAVGKGNATITAASYDGSVSAICQVTVTWDTHVHTETIDKGYAPTCTEPGLSDGKHCDVCGEMLLAQEEIPATGHTEVVDPGRAPSCTEPGVSEGKHCGVCNEILVEQNEMQAIGHHWIDATCAAPKTCERCGITDGEPHGQHDDVVEVIEPTCTEGGYTKITCQVCGDTVIKDEVEPLGHDFAEATTEAPKTCKVCGETEGDPLPKPEEPTEPEDPTTPEDPTVPEEPAKDHNECEGNWFTNILNAIINFFRRLIGLPEKCVCGEEI